MSNENKQLTASQRLAGLESASAALDQAVYNLTVQSKNQTDALRALVVRQNAMLSLLRSGLALTEENIEADIVRQTSDGLKQALDEYKEKGILVAAEEVSAMSFLVTRELDGSGKVTNPRLQFAYESLKDNVKELIKGKKIGESIKLDDSDDKVIEIEEIYNMVIPEAPKLAEAQQ